MYSFLKPILLLGVVVVFSSCHVNNIKTDERIQKIFEDKKINGGFMWMDNTKGEFTVSNIQHDTARRFVANSIALPLALIAVETGLIPNERHIILPKDSIHLVTWLYTPKEKTSSLIYDILDKGRVRYFLDTLHYGTPTDSIFQKRLSADEQLGFMKRLYFNQLPFSNRSMQLVKKALKTHTQRDIKISYIESDEASSPYWSIGFIEKGKNIYFFSGYVESATASISSETIKKVIDTLLANE